MEELACQSQSGGMMRRWGSDKVRRNYSQTVFMNKSISFPKRSHQLSASSN